MALLKILRPGLLTTVQDCGRWGFQARGVPVAGAMDLYSHRVANAIVGNARDAASLEVTLLGPHVEFDAPVVFAVAGAEFHLTLDGASVRMNEPVEARRGANLRFGNRIRGARGYLAIAGGIAVPMVLNSRSTHVASGMGGHQGRALRIGDQLEMASSAVSSAIPKARSARPLLLPDGGAKVRVLDGAYTQQLAGTRYQISTRSDRMGYRLEGPTAIAAVPAELISSAVPMGAIQLPPIGQPILLMADRATTGGYAVAATVITADLPIAAQLAPGDWIAFERCSLDDADVALRAREQALAEGAA